MKSRYYLYEKCKAHGCLSIKSDAPEDAIRNGFPQFYSVSPLWYYLYKTTRITPIRVGVWTTTIEFMWKHFIGRINRRLHS